MNRIGIVGTGNVAWHLGSKLDEAGCQVKIVGRKKKVPRGFKDLFYSYELEAIKDVELVIICVSDDAIPKIAQTIQGVIDKNCIVCHTSGSVSSRVLNEHENYGVFYPLQTLTKFITVEKDELPIFVTANNSKNNKILQSIAAKISDEVNLINDQERQQLHLSAVILNNFSNHLVHLVQEFVEVKKLSFEYLRPLMEMTIKKLKKTTAYDAQTGPARRKDNASIKNHLKLLEGQVQLKRIYNLLTTSIVQTYEDNRRNSTPNL